MLDDPKLYEKMHSTRQNIPAIDSTGPNTPYACISCDSDYCITKYKPNLVNNVCARKFPTFIKVLVNTLVFNVFKRNFRYKSV